LQLDRGPSSVVIEKVVQVTWTMDQTTAKAKAPSCTLTA